MALVGLFRPLRQKAEGRKQKAEGGKEKAKGKGQRGCIDGSHPLEAGIYFCH
jgi:hypothetical protein